MNRFGRVLCLVALGALVPACEGCSTSGTSSEDAGAGAEGNGSSSGGFIRGSSSGGNGGSSGASSNGGSGSSGSGVSGSSGGSSSGDNGCTSAEVCGDGLDNDCNGSVDEDCNCEPGATQRCYDGPPAQAGVGVCTFGTTTCIQLGESYWGWSNCEGAGHPQEVVCGQHQDFHCNGIIDEGCPCEQGTTRPCYTGPAGTEGRGACTGGTQTCELQSDGSTAFGECQGQVTPSPDTCDGVDHDCNGAADTGCACTPGTTQPCYSGAAGTAGVGTCHAGTQTCAVSPSGGSAWGACTGEVIPAAEQCDGLDHDCNGTANNGCACQVGESRNCYTGPAGTENVGLCHGGTQQCVDVGQGPQWGACTGEVTPTAAVCDGQDHACDGNPNAACECTVGESRDCYDGPPGTQGVGVCSAGRQFCVNDNGTPRWGNLCIGQVTPASSETCNNGQDETCNGQADEGCPPAGLTCPGNQTVPAGDTVTLSAPGVGVSNQQWTITNGPVGGASSAQWNPDPPTGSTVTFRPIIVGVYTVTVTATDGGGNPVSCSFQVTAEAHGLRIELAWDGSGDVDIHLHNNSSAPWFGGDDCYYENCITPPNTPSYASAAGPMPWGAGLDVDNVVTDGPENVRLDNPVLNSPYTIGIHNYANAAGRVATVKVFCGDGAGVTPTQVFTSQPLAGTAAGDCTANQFWKVATVVMTSTNACTITPLQTYVASSDACAGF
ncbi:MAG: MopE-related protein [Myxococcota bacterium]